MKRKAEEDPEADGTKTARRSHELTMAYPNGAIRITRTPGRQNDKNCVNLADIIHKDYLVSACIYAFFIADEELLRYLPVSRSSDAMRVSSPPFPT